MKRIMILGLWLCSAYAIAQPTMEKGKLLYQHACSHCHAPSKAKGLGAPAAFNSKQWGARIEKATKEIKDNHRFKTVDDYLLYQIQLGKGLMHHGGLCSETREKHQNLECDEDAYLSAIDYMTHKK